MKYEDIIAELAKHNVPCWIINTGGGCMTLHIGEPLKVTEANATDEFTVGMDYYPITAGPGYHDANELAHFCEEDELYIGPDTFGPHADEWSATAGDVDAAVKIILERLGMQPTAGEIIADLKQMGEM